ncbi:hypothetical protein EON65_41040 [archaeon]|nr:MAG: hypothetical protein EON65_41040 [archaeon]
MLTGLIILPPANSVYVLNRSMSGTLVSTKSPTDAKEVTNERKPYNASFSEIFLLGECHNLGLPHLVFL